jgi:ribose 1,5-bisphosphokinase
VSREPQDDGCTSLELGPGALALIVGPSGAGKDALLAAARTKLVGDPRFAFPARIVTRPQHSAENHGSMTEAEFATAMRRGDFALTWQAHGLHYGIPASIDRAIIDGRIVVVNGSRTISGALRLRYARSSLILIDCPPEIRATRLALRGRETVAAMQARLTRRIPAFDAEGVDIRIDNSGALADGECALIAALMSLSRREI